MIEIKTISLFVWSFFHFTYVVMQTLSHSGRQNFPSNDKRYPEKNQRKNHGLSSEGRNETCTCCHSLITPDLPGSFNLNQIGLLPTLADAGVFLPISTKSKPCASTCVCAWVCVRVCYKHTGRGHLEKNWDFLLWGAGRGKTANLLANDFSLKKPNSRLPDICNLRLVFSSLFWSNPQY